MVLRTTKVSIKRILNLVLLEYQYVGFQTSKKNLEL
jgi:hypothetical protein